MESATAEAKLSSTTEAAPRELRADASEMADATDDATERAALRPLRSNVSSPMLVGWKRTCALADEGGTRERTRTCANRATR